MKSLRKGRGRGWKTRNGVGGNSAIAIDETNCSRWNRSFIADVKFLFCLFVTEI